MKSSKAVVLNRLQIATEEARRFIARAEAAKAQLSTTEHYYSSKPYASAKRASLDLSNALAAMRKPIWQYSTRPAQ